jgi:hypothetical protein
MYKDNVLKITRNGHKHWQICCAMTVLLAHIKYKGIF